MHRGPYQDPSDSEAVQMTSNGDGATQMPEAGSRHRARWEGGQEARVEVGSRHGRFLAALQMPSSGEEPCLEARFVKQSQV